jgi:hypothetical protein
VAYLRSLFVTVISDSNRKSVEAELTELLDLNQKQIEAMEAAQRKEEKLEDESSLDIYCSVDELREKVNRFPNSNSMFVSNSYNKFDNSNCSGTAPDRRDALQEISLNKVSMAGLECAVGPDLTPGLICVYHNHLNSQWLRMFDMGQIMDLQGKLI